MIWTKVEGSNVQPYFRFHRSITRPFFSQNRIGDFEMLDRHADLVISQLKERFSQGVAVNIHDLLSRYTMDTATVFLFGQDVKSLSGQLPYPSTYRGNAPLRDHPSDRFTSAFNRAQEYSYPRGFLAKTWRLVEFWEDTVGTQMGITDEFIGPLVYAALRKKKETKELEAGNDDETLLDYLVKQTDGTKKTCLLLDLALKGYADFDVIRDETVNILLAGRDTVRAIVGFITIKHTQSDPTRLLHWLLSWC